MTQFSLNLTSKYVSTWIEMKRLLIVKFYRCCFAVYSIFTCYL